MKKTAFLTIVLFAWSLFILADTTTEKPGEKDPTKPTPEKETVTRIISVTGQIGPVLTQSDDFEYDSPYVKINILVNLSENLSIGFGAQLLKYKGPESYVIEADGYLPPYATIAEVENIVFTPGYIEESSYGAVAMFRFFDSPITPYVFGGLYYTSITYEQYVGFTTVDTGTDYAVYAWKRFDGIKGTAGGGLSIALASYMDVLLEGEYTSFLTLDSFEDLFITSIGFRFTI